jgi:D-arginine dehydrogenase
VRRHVDAVVVGAGIAGLAVGAELAGDRSVLVIEREHAPATQSSARSASSWIPRYGSSPQGALALASEDWFRAGGDGYADRSLLHPRGLLLITDQASSVGLRTATAAGARPIDAGEARRRYPPLRDGVVAAAAYDPACEDIETPVAIAAFRSRLETRGGRLEASTTIETIRRAGASWTVTTTARSFGCGLIVDAAGAWGDEVARMAGVPPVGLRAFRRTACLFRPRSGVDAASLPLLYEADEAFYVKPESGAMLASPADETEQPPGPAEPTDDAVALGLARVRSFTDLEPAEVGRRWAGLRSFVADRAPVLGPDPAANGFAWYVGLGGSGIMTAPAAARSVVRLIDDGQLPGDVVEAGAEAPALLPDRLPARA